jgi:hypothetical protein
MLANDDGQYRFVLYVDSTKPKSLRACERLKELCQKQLSGAYTLDFVELRDHPELFEKQKIIAVPTLDIFNQKSEKHRFVGDLSSSDGFIIAIGLMQKAMKMSKEAASMRETIKMQR